ncbi:MAG: lipoate--protein ligase family protein [Opitutales bacterium]|jgi:lipoate-protein ligase A
MQICEIPYDSATAADNMAIDAVMLDFGCRMEEVMWRLYGWDEPSVTFGYSQEWEWVRSAIPGFTGAMVRRMTGGGIVDHRHDLTYALSIAPGHPFYRRPATDLYSGLHQQITAILLDLGFKAELAPCQQPCDESAPREVHGICFEAPEPHDVVIQSTRTKLAGAAMKRNQSGVLIQGSISMNLLSGLSRKNFGSAFGSLLASWLGCSRSNFTGTLALDDLLRERKRYSSAEWNRKR